MHPDTNPRYMSDEQRIQYAIDQMDSAYSALCWIGTGWAGIAVPVRPGRVQRAIARLDKAITSLEKEQESK